MKVAIRPLQEEDASISYKWRNNPEIWKYTESKPDMNITYEIELNWLQDVLQRPNEKRFAICVDDDHQYVGNVQLTDINQGVAQFHIFIGEVVYHGMGIGTKATSLMLDYAFSVLGLNAVYLFVNKNNAVAIKMYENCGFYKLEESSEMIKMEIIDEPKKN